MAIRKCVISCHVAFSLKEVECMLKNVRVCVCVLHSSYCIAKINLKNIKRLEHAHDREKPCR